MGYFLGLLASISSARSRANVTSVAGVETGALGQRFSAACLIISRASEDRRTLIWMSFFGMVKGCH